MKQGSQGAEPPVAPSAGVEAPETIEIAAGVFKDTCLQLMDQVNERPLEYLITKRGRPVAKLVPPGTSSASAFGYLRGTVLEQADLVEPDFEAWGDLA